MRHVDLADGIKKGIMGDWIVKTIRVDCHKEVDPKV